METKSSDRPTVIEVQPPSPRYTAAAAGAPRKIAIPVDLSDESAYAVSWAVQNYLRPGDAVTLIHVRPTSVLYGADWGSTHFSAAAEEEFDSLTAGKIAEIAQPLADAKIGFKVHVVKDHDMKERLCLEIERLGMSVVIMGSRGFGASRSSSKARLGSVSDYCVHHCVCPVVVVRYPDDDGLHPVPEEEAAITVEAEADEVDVSKMHLHAD
ncbi:hypothetical protein RND81_11G178700 [Saponaria officinalis]|uniref:UspA domain-containing protein n=1 Tax=Saponaria officinalis TaxID=3572 RepID=A0AAW1HND1_SAPOF